jgi:hypothetical protein
MVKAAVMKNQNLNLSGYNYSFKCMPKYNNKNKG